MGNAIRIILIFLIVAVSACSPEPEGNSSSSRWFERTLYFALSGSDPERNNFFHKERVREGIREIEQLTSLGLDYFSFKEVDESIIDPTSNDFESKDFKNFILIWPEAIFNSYVLNELGGGNPDSNAVAIINSANKRQFFIIFKSTCFSSSSSCNNIGVNGVKAMIARQLGFLIGMTSANCAINPTSVMCASNSAISDAQWGVNPKVIYSNNYNNILEQILNTEGFYPK